MTYFINYQSVNIIEDRSEYVPNVPDLKVQDFRIKQSGVYGYLTPLSKIFQIYCYLFCSGIQFKNWINSELSVPMH